MDVSSPEDWEKFASLLEQLRPQASGYRSTEDWDNCASLLRLNQSATWLTMLQVTRELSSAKDQPHTY
ncbi:unnamed protein product [Caenorhabditis auriculariae]|uniref:Uncharacterized protein n=1 Tax=Caenorhabditis auriculariae TaxID=2777116 RepID=A0A8S1HLD7_9PELO|nr:unnamed protein product [Caenorhabditis auriculariae]